MHKTNGQYTRARKKMEELEAAAVVEGGSRRRRLLARGTLDPAESDVIVASPAARDGGGRALRAWGKKSPPPPPPPVPGAGSVMYMVVGFEVVACSIFRRPGAARLDDIPCPVSPEDPDAPSPMEVKEGAPRCPLQCCHACQQSLPGQTLYLPAPCQPQVVSSCQILVAGRSSVS